MSNICVVIPAFKVKQHILDVIDQIEAQVRTIIVVDDACPEYSGAWVQSQCTDNRIKVIFHQENQGVGGAMVTGYKAALEDASIDIIIKLDGDGQMNPGLIPVFVQHIEKGHADYVKGNRFFHPEDVKSMPLIRLVGNAICSFMTKFSSGYWNIFDPTNGFTAIHSRVLRELPLDKIHKGYFFESDILFRLNIIRAAITDIPMKAHYGDEESNFSLRKNFLPFFFGNLRNSLKRILYNYFLRNFSVASIELLLSLILIPFSLTYGSQAWLASIESNVPASSGTVMLAALPLIVGLQMLLAFLNHDIASVPKESLSKKLY